jgi:hypothetical protein
MIFLYLPQWPCEVYSQRQTSHAINNCGNLERMSLTAKITGPFGSSAFDPNGSFSQVGTPNKRTDDKPFSTRGLRNPSSLSIPHLKKNKSF